MRRIYNPVDIARQFKFVRETLGPNRGVWVEAFQRLGDGKPGDSWCADFVSGVLWICYQGPPPLPRTGSCDVMWAIAKELETKAPQPGDVFFRVRQIQIPGVAGKPGKQIDDAHHVGFVTQVYPDRVKCIAGNTSEDGQSSNGTGVFENDLRFSPSLRFARLPIGDGVR